MKGFCTLVISLILSCSMGLALAVEPLTVHEWGTITTRHAPDGSPQGRLNRITRDEVLPSFVHTYEPEQTANAPDRSLQKTPATPGRPDVTMRLETPVLYFYPPNGKTGQSFNVSVRFRGGIVNEFYPKGAASVALDNERIMSKQQAGVITTWNGDVLNNYVVGSLRWDGVQFSETAIPPQTSKHVWLTPRQVRSALLKTPAGEGEKYLFYRGVAHLDALLQTEHTSSRIIFRAPKHLHWMNSSDMTLTKIWFVDIRRNGESAFYEVNGKTIVKTKPSQELWRTSLMKPEDYSLENRKRLRRSMKQALVDAGLYDDEAEAMLETWRDGYFNNPGLRVFYTVPPEWIEYHLPLQISVPHRLTRVLIGRIDLLN